MANAPGPVQRPHAKFCVRRRKKGTELPAACENLSGLGTSVQRHLEPLGRPQHYTTPPREEHGHETTQEAVALRQHPRHEDALVCEAAAETRARLATHHADGHELPS